MPGKNWSRIKAALPPPCVIAQLLTVIALFLFTVLAFAGATDDPDKTFNRGNSAEPVTLDPHRSEDVATGNILRDLFEGLTTEDRDGSIIPGSAENWDISADGMVYTFHLRNCLAWSNGEALTAADFMFSLKRAVDPETGAPMASLLAPVVNATAIMRGGLDVDKLGIEMPDSHTLIIKLIAPTPWFLQILAQPVAFPVYATSIIEHGNKAFAAGKLVSNGAYRLEAWSPYERVSLTRNDKYRDNANSWFSRVIYYPIDNNNAEFNRYRAGELDWTDTIPPNKLKIIKRDLPGQDFISPYLGTYYYGFNLTREPFKDKPELRQALSLAIDRKVIAEKLLGNGELPAERWLPPGIEGVESDQTNAKVTRQQQITEAKNLYQKAGFSKSNPLHMTLHYNSSEQNKRIAVAISAMWKSILGIKTELINEEWKVFLGHRKGKIETQAYRASWIADFNDASSFLTMFTTGHAKNDTGYANTDYDKLVEEITVNQDAAVRSKQIAQAEQTLLDEQIIIPIYYYVSRHLVKPAIRGYQANPMDHHYSRYLYRDR
jgi:oligopeptide transport system substrate-binding protein